ncbi:MAG: hypothetical protein EPO50_28990 [Reyranella sp.]|nr:MAG: hypothetical protein EPO50_28990 [Reyranella sp.]
MSEPMTQREAALAARVAELEAGAARKPKPGGNIVEQIWHYLSYFVPPTIMVAGVLVFVLFHVWEYYNASLKTAAETRIKEAQATIKNAEARANTSDVDGMKLRVARFEPSSTSSGSRRQRRKSRATLLTARLKARPLKFSGCKRRCRQGSCKPKQPAS